MQPQLPVRIEYLDADGVLQTTPLLMSLQDAGVQEQLLVQAGNTVLRRVRQTIPGDSFSNASQYGSPWARWLGELCYSSRRG